jgi:hypothetical protein
MASKREVLMIRQIYKSVMRAATPEDILQVAPGASAEYVKTEWKARSLVVHPDKSSGALTNAEANAATKKINDAKDVLLGKAPRARPATAPSAGRTLNGLKIESVAQTAVTLAWEQGSAQSFEVQWRKTRGAWNNFGTVRKSKTRVSGLDAGATYAFRVRRAAGGEWSHEVSAQLSAPATPTKAPKKRAQDAPPSTSSKKRRATQERIHALVHLQWRSEFDGGDRVVFRLLREDRRWPEIEEVVLFDRSELTKELDFPSRGKPQGDGCLFMLSGRVKPNTWQDKTNLIVSDDERTFALARRPGSRVCLDCDARIDDDEALWFTRCTPCYARHRDE